MTVSRRYQQTLVGYLRWLPKDRFLRPSFVDDPSGIDAASAMLQWESQGKSLPLGCTEPDLLADYVQAKRSRDWHISEWRQGVTEGYFLWWEFIGTFDLSTAETRKIFGLFKRDVHDSDKHDRRQEPSNSA